MQNFLQLARDTLIAAAWLDTNANKMHSEVTKPWVVTASEEEINTFVERQLTQDCGFADLGNHTVFDFQDGKEMKAFLREMRSRIPVVRVNAALFGEDYLANNVQFL